MSRLEDIKNMVDTMDGDVKISLFGFKVPPENIIGHFKWLIEQAEQNRQLRKALSFYADESKYAERGDYWQIVNDEGKTARNALEGSS